MMRSFGIATAFAKALRMLAVMTPFAFVRGVYRKRPKARAGREFQKSFALVDRSSSIQKLQRAARKGQISLPEPTIAMKRRHAWFRKQEADGLHALQGA